MDLTALLSSSGIKRNEVACLPKGWIREEIVRTAGSSTRGGSNSKGGVDVFYYSPKGQRVKNKSEMSKVLGEEYDLSVFDFHSGKICQQQSQSSSSNVSSSSSKASKLQQQQNELTQQLQALLTPSQLQQLNGSLAAAAFALQQGGLSWPSQQQSVASTSSAKSSAKNVQSNNIAPLISQQQQHQQGLTQLQKQSLHQFLSLDQGGLASALAGMTGGMMNAYPSVLTSQSAQSHSQNSRTTSKDKSNALNKPNNDLKSTQNFYTNTGNGVPAQSMNMAPGSNRKSTKENGVVVKDSVVKLSTEHSFTPVSDQRNVENVLEGEHQEDNELNDFLPVRHLARRAYQNSTHNQQCSINIIKNHTIKESGFVRKGDDTSVSCTSTENVDDSPSKNVQVLKNVEAELLCEVDSKESDLKILSGLKPRQLFWVKRLPTDIPLDYHSSSSRSSATLPLPLAKACNGVVQNSVVPASQEMVVASLLNDDGALSKIDKIKISEKHSSTVDELSTEDHDLTRYAYWPLTDHSPASYDNTASSEYGQQSVTISDVEKQGAKVAATRKRLADALISLQACQC